MLTWDSRGFGQSGGTVTVDYKDNEGRDVQALIDYLAKQPEALLDAPGRPARRHARRLLRGRDRARGRRLRAADRRDRARHRLALAADRRSTRRRRSRAAGRSRSTAPACRPPGWRASSRPPACRPATSTRTSPPRSSRARAPASSPPRTARGSTRAARPSLVDAIRVPTLLIQGTADTLFTLDEAITNYRILRGNGVPAKMIWFCGGHGTCLTGERRGRPRRARRDRVDEAPPGGDALGRHRARASSGSPTTPEWRSAADYPPPAGAPLVAEGAGRLADQPRRRASPAARSRPAAPPTPSTCRCPRRPRAVQAVGAPALTLTYTGTGAAPDGYAFAQIVDEARGVVVGNQVRADPARARRQAAHDRAAAGGRSPPASRRSRGSRCRSPAAARSTGRRARRPTCRSPRRG